MLSLIDSCLPPGARDTWNHLSKTQNGVESGFAQGLDGGLLYRSEGGKVWILEMYLCSTPHIGRAKKDPPCKGRQHWNREHCKFVLSALNTVCTERQKRMRVKRYASAKASQGTRTVRSKRVTHLTHVITGLVLYCWNNPKVVSSKN